MSGAIIGTMGTKPELKLPPDIQPGAMLAGRYRIGRMLGSGGMGAVFAAEHVDLSEPVAIKVLLNDGSTQASAEALSRFMREAWAASKIKSEYVARVNDLGRLANGTPYIVMEYLDGNDLEAQLRTDGPLAIELAVELVLQACEALAEAHVLGIFHRDLKPSNLFCVQRSDGLMAVKLLDFGISKISRASTETDPRLTSTATTLGTPLYMSPEQMRSGRLADERSDIWSLGVILYELLSGHVPFSADNLADLAVKIATETPTPLSEARAEVPVELSQAIARCLDKERSQRFANVAELARALAPFGPSRALAHAERAERILQATHTSTPRARITPLTISTAITALGSHSRLRGVGPERSLLAFGNVPKRALWIGGAALVGAAAIGALSWGMYTRDASIVQPKAEETRTQAAQADEQVPSIATAEALERPAQSTVLDALPTGAGAPLKASSSAKAEVASHAAKALTEIADDSARSAKPVEPTTAPAATAQGATPAGEKAAAAAAVAEAQATAPAAEKASAPKAKTATPEPTAKATAAVPATKADAPAKPRPPAAAAASALPKAAEPKPETEAKPVAPPAAAPKAKDSELDSLGGRL